MFKPASRWPAASFLIFGLVSAAANAQVTGGPFTAAQAERGKVVYAQFCAACHGESLTGGKAPTLAGEAFQVGWSHPDVTIDDLFYLIRVSMPPGAALSVTAADQAAVTAYLLQANGYAAGEKPLARGATELKQHFPWAGKFRSSYGVGARSPELAVATGPDFIAGDPSAVPAAAGPSQAMLQNAEQSSDWLVHDHDYAGTRYAPLAQINPSNAARLRPAAMFQIGESDNFQTGPLVHQGVMYLTTKFSTIALEATTGRLKWKHTWQPQANTPSQRNRGVAMKEGYLVRGMPDGYLVALNAATGQLVWARRVAKTELAETFTMPPVIFEDLVLIGPGISEFNVHGWFGAFSLKDGREVWRFHLIPEPGEPGYETWPDPKKLPWGGGGVWTATALDPATGEIHVAVGNPTPDFAVKLRPGANLYTNSVVALDARTGKLRWYRQLTPNDSHDWDLTHAAPLFSPSSGAKRGQFIATVGKDGLLRTIDRKTNEIIYTTPITTIENADIPVTTTPTHAKPGRLGGVQWNGPAYNPQLNQLYVAAVDWGTTFVAFEEARYIPGKNYYAGRRDDDPAESAQGWLTAVDASTGAVKWKYRSSRPMVAAVTTTAGNLVLTGELGGDFLALDARDGHELYRFNTGGEMGGGVITYEVNGKQYIAAASGSPSPFWAAKSPGAPTLVIFSLP